MPTPRPRRRKDGSIAWQVSFNVRRDARQVQSSVTFDDAREAVRWAELVELVGSADALEVLAQRRGSGPVPRTLTEWLYLYIDHLTGVEEATKDRYRAYVVNDIEEFMGQLPVEAITQFTDAEWVLYLQAKGNKAKTIANKHSFLCAAMAAAASSRPTPLISYNPCAGTRLPRVDAPELAFLEPREYELLLEAMPQQWRVQTEFMLASMARPSEVGALLVGDIDRQACTVRVNKAWKYAGGRLKLGPPKTKRSIRTINVPAETIALLDLDRPKDELLFHTRTGNPVTVVYYYKKAWTPAMKHLVVRDDRGSVVHDRLGKHVTPYTLRHTGITWRLLAGVPLYVVSRDAGHESVETTDKRYGHFDRAASAASASGFAARLPRLHQGLTLAM